MCVCVCVCVCHILAAKEFQGALLSGDKSLELRCPIKESTYTQHAGAVYGLHCCPHQVRYVTHTHTHIDTHRRT